MPDPLTSLARVRALAVDDAKRALADCLAAESAARQALRTLDHTIAAETEAASDPSGDDRTVEIFSAWLCRIATERQTAASALERAEVRSNEARIVLTMGRSAARATEELLAERAEAEHTRRTVREQAALDEAGRRARDR